MLNLPSAWRYSPSKFPVLRQTKDLFASFTSEFVTKYVMSVILPYLPEAPFVWKNKSCWISCPRIFNDYVCWKKYILLLSKYTIEKCSSLTKKFATVDVASSILCFWSGFWRLMYLAHSIEIKIWFDVQSTYLEIFIICLLCPWAQQQRQISIKV